MRTIKKPFFTASWLVLCYAVASITASADMTPVDEDELKASRDMHRAVDGVLYLMGRYHYTQMEIDDELSEKILGRYLKTLDPTRSYFLKSDIEDFEIYRTRLDNALRDSSLKPAFEIFKILRERVKSRIEYATSLLEEEFDFSVDEYLKLDRSEAPWTVNEAELNELWRLRVKNDVLNLRLDERPEEEIKDVLARRYKRQVDQIFQTQPDDVFEMFMNAYAAEVEPHTSYFSKRSAENFRIHMSLSLEGIGAALTTDQDYTVVNRIIPGGPADKSNQLHPEDKIIGVGQGEDPIENVIGWRLMDVVDLIRGSKGSLVRLEILPADSPPGAAHETLDLIRDKIKLEEQAAKKTSVTINQNNHDYEFAVISLSSFYSDFEGRANNEEDYRSSTRDVRRLLAEVNEENTTGVIIDLRGNGGGSLEEATDLTGLFIRSGPIVQIRDHSGEVDTKSDPDAGVVYDGPLIVMVDRYSASASEIFAGAIQDYGRGLIVGERTFGKGTVQQLLNLNQLTREEEELGQLKFTTAQFFRISGHSTQHKGVVPDIELNLGERDQDYGERSLDNALPWALIQPVSYKGNILKISLIKDLQEEHINRTSSDPSFQYLRARNLVSKNARDIDSLPLNEAQRKQQREQQNIEALEQLNQYRSALGLETVTRETRRESKLPGGDDHWDTVLHEEAARIQLDEALVSRPTMTITRTNGGNAGIEGVVNSAN